MKYPKLYLPTRERAASATSSNHLIKKQESNKISPIGQQLNLIYGTVTSKL